MSFNIKFREKNIERTIEENFIIKSFLLELFKRIEIEEKKFEYLDYDKIKHYFLPILIDTFLNFQEREKLINLIVNSMNKKIDKKLLKDLKKERERLFKSEKEVDYYKYLILDFYIKYLERINLFLNTIVKNNLNVEDLIDEKDEIKKLLTISSLTYLILYYLNHKENLKKAALLAEEGLYYLETI